MSCHIHIICSLADFHVRRWRRGRRCYHSQKRLPNSQQQFESHQWILVRAPEDISIRSIASNKRFPEEISSKFGGLSTGCQTISIRDCCNQKKYFKPNHDFLPNSFQDFFNVLNQNLYQMILNVAETQTMMSQSVQWRIVGDWVQ